MHARRSVGTPRGVVITHIDITARKLVEQTLHESEELFRAVFDQASVCIAVTQAAENAPFLQNEFAFEEMLGYARGNLSVCTFHAIGAPEDRAISQRKVQAILAGEVSSARWKSAYLHRGGHTVWAKVMLSLVREQDGTPKFFVASVMDITGCKKSADELGRERCRRVSQFCQGSLPGV